MHTTLYVHVVINTIDAILYRLPSAVSQTLSVASQPIDPKYSSSHELCHFIQEQRKIISTFRAQPWPMQVKLAALRYAWLAGRQSACIVTSIELTSGICIIQTMVAEEEAAFFVIWIANCVTLK